MSDEHPPQTDADADMSDSCLSAVHRYDIDRIYGRFREQDESISGVRTRVTVLEQRVGSIDERLIEHRAMLVEVRASVRHVDREVGTLHQDLDEIKTSQRHMRGQIERFTAEQCQRAQGRTEAIHSLTRILIGIFAALGVLSVSLASLLALAGERGESLLQLVLSLFGLSG